MEKGVYNSQDGVFANVKKCIIENNFYDGIGAWTQTTLIVEESTIQNNGLSNDWGSGVGFGMAHLESDELYRSEPS